MAICGSSTITGIVVSFLFCRNDPTATRRRYDYCQFSLLFVILFKGCEQSPLLPIQGLPQEENGQPHVSLRGQHLVLPSFIKTSQIHIHYYNRKMRQISTCTFFIHAWHRGHRYLYNFAGHTPWQKSMAGNILTSGSVNVLGFRCVRCYKWKHRSHVFFANHSGNISSIVPKFSYVFIYCSL